MSYLEELLPEFRKGAKIRLKKWQSDAYIEICGQGIIYYNIEAHEVDILADDYELYQEPIDWDYIIKNKCLCWFGNETIDFCGFLEEIDEEVKHKFIMLNNEGFRKCRPVRRDEVTFYEDRKK